jgi:hypothetical protein
MPSLDNRMIGDDFVMRHLIMGFLFVSMMALTVVSLHGQVDARSAGLPLVPDTAGAGVIGRLPGSTATTQWYGHLAKTSAGLIVYGYAYGGAQLRCRTSRDDGRTWSDFRAVHDVAPGHITGGASFGITSRGVWIFLFSEDTAAKPYPKNLALRSIRSTDEGVTWSAPVTIPTTMPFGITGGIAEFPDGTLITAYAEGFYGYTTFTGLYGNPRNADTTYIRILKSTDGGAHWGPPVTAYAHHQAKYQLNRPFLDEPAIAVDRKGRAVIICRTPDYGTGELTSADGGAAWQYRGIIGQTNCGPGVYSNNAAPCLMTFHDSLFVAIVGYRLNADGPGTEAGKAGWMHILRGTWDEIRNATIGWSTLLPPSRVEYGDAAAHRGIVASDGALVMVQMQGGRVYHMQDREMAGARKEWLGMSTKGMRYWALPDHVWEGRVSPQRLLTDTLFTFVLRTPPPRDPSVAAVIGAIPVIDVAAVFAKSGRRDTAWVTLSDVNGIVMPSGEDSLQFRLVAGMKPRPVYQWRTWFPTRLRDASGNVILGQFEKPLASVHVRVRSTPGVVLRSIRIRMGYILK